MLSQACKYAIRAVLYLAERDSGTPRLCKGIASELDVPEHFLAKILQDLVRNGILVSFKGRGGGFSVNRSTDEIGLVEIVEAVDGRVFGEESFLGFNTCSEEMPCQMHTQWVPIKRDIMRMLSEKTLQQFADEAAADRSVPAWSCHLQAGPRRPDVVF